MNKKSLSIFLIILFAILSRIIPHPPNFAPFGAIALFGAAFFANRFIAFIVPIISIYVSGLLINNLFFKNLYPSFTWFDENIIWQSFAYILTVGFAILLFRKSVSMNKIALGGFSAAIIFYLITNFGFWSSGLLWPVSPSGLFQCYIAGLPFLTYQILGDLTYSISMFAAYYFIFGRNFQNANVKS
ncbi:MAG: hypothetical protein RLZZ546_387 [Bacteroidota bacterium]|jgi:hypothetical protein